MQVLHTRFHTYIFVWVLKKVPYKWTCKFKPVLFKGRLFMERPHCDYPVISQWAFGLFPLWAVMNNAAVDIRVRVFVQTCVFTSLGSIPGSGIAGPCGVCFTLWELPDSSPSLTCGVRGFPGSEAGGLGGLWSFLPDDLFQIQSWECRLEAGRWWETVALEGSDWVQCV